VCSYRFRAGPFAISVVFPFPLSREMGFDPGVFGRFDLAALVQPHLKFLFVCFIDSIRWRSRHTEVLVA